MSLVKNTNNQLLLNNPSIVKEQNKSIKTNSSNISSISLLKTNAQTNSTNPEENFSKKETVEEYLKINYPPFFFFF